MQLASITIFAVLLLSAFDRHVTAQQGFVSIDCGGRDTTYTDAETQIVWTSDGRGFGLENVSRVMNVSLPAKYPAWTWLNSMRIFEGSTQTKYCYVFDNSYGIVPTNPYLIRASFWTGDKLPFSTPNKEQISFKLLINADVWDDIAISLPQKDPLVKEVYVVAALPSISVCVGGSSDPAFISSLELRPIRNTWKSVNFFMQAQDNKAPKYLFLFARRDFGSSSGKDIRYPQDTHDRIWSANTIGHSLFTPRIITSSNQVDDTPSVVLQTARSESSSFNITFDGFTRSYNFYYDIYFAEISDVVTAPGQRVFMYETITALGIQRQKDNIDPFNNVGHVIAYHSGGLVGVEEGGFLTFSLKRKSISSYGPLISALELRYSSQYPMSLGTDEDEVLTLDLIKKNLQGFDSWSGDPCLPFSYEWLTCNQEIRPHITKLSLQNKNITAEIPKEIGKLQALIEIDLRGNNLSGSIPDSIAQLPNLTTLLLQDNNLSGTIPQALLKKNLDFSVAGNPILCKDNNATYCGEQPKSNVDSKKSPLVVILVSISAIAVVFVLASIFIFYFKRKGKVDQPIAITHEEVMKHSNLAQHFTSQQIERITNGFKTKIGAGGFGDVFFGTLSSGLDVAVKVSSHPNGAQEGSEFLNEVALLSRVHHRNLVEFVGYCIQPRLVLVYEYMKKGSLDDYLHGNVKVPLSWRDRLKIIVGAAHGLEYLHKGCKPPIIHRDVKCSNILLDEQLEGKISDFGISRSKLATNTQMTVTHVQGTIGYIAPEYLELRITEKVDVFAFGVVLLEVVSRRRPFEGQQHIVNWVRPLMNQGDIQKIVDPDIVADYNMSSMRKVLEVAMACVEQETERRPDMHEVSSELNSVLSFELQNETIMLAYDTADFPSDSVNVLTS